ncbi:MULTISPECIES: hypothetical protein [Rufibacter]|uniref:hypothetical protein n=1 Tax=Rufibacter TaxID=1379908 RepID=UPI00137A13C5|nr:MULTISPECIES: hypothetical protein [Rufibacter]
MLISLPNLPILAGGLGSDKLLWEANQLFRDYKDSEALEKYEQVLANDPLQMEALCKASLVSGRIGNRFSDDTSKGIYFKKAFAFAERAVAAEPAKAEPNYVMALALSYLCHTASLKVRMEQMVQVKYHLDAALASDPEHAASWHLLGRLKYKLANLSFAERTASKLFNISQLPVETNEQAIEAIKKSIELAPSNLLYYYDLARVQREVNQKTECVTTLQKALDQKLITTEDLELNRKCKVLLQEVMNVRS